MTLSRLCPTVATPLLAAGIALLAGCSREEIISYKVPKEAPPAATSPHGAMGGMGGMPGMMGRMAMPTVKWATLPDGWTEKPAERMRVAAFQVVNASSAAEVTVIPLPGATGIELESVNLWRSELSLPPVQKEDMKGLESSATVAGSAGRLFELAGEASTASGKTRARTLGAILEQAGTLWFIKMSGADELVSAQKSAFTNFLAGLSLEAAAPSMPAMGSAPADSGSAPADAPNWPLPEGWAAQSPGPMILASFKVTTADGKADATVSKFPGDVGGVLANVNRWRGQLGLAPVDEASLPTQTQLLDLGDAKATLVDMIGTNQKTSQPSRMLGAIVPRGSDTWFYKLTGPEKVVGTQKDSFVKFIATAH